MRWLKWSWLLAACFALAFACGENEGKDDEGTGGVGATGGAGGDGGEGGDGGAGGGGGELGEGGAGGEEEEVPYACTSEDFEAIERLVGPGYGLLDENFEELAPNQPLEGVVTSVSVNEITITDADAEETTIHWFDNELGAYFPEETQVEASWEGDWLVVKSGERSAALYFWGEVGMSDPRPVPAYESLTFQYDALCEVETVEACAKSQFFALEVGGSGEDSEAVSISPKGRKILGEWVVHHRGSMVMSYELDGSCNTLFGTALAVFSNTVAPGGGDDGGNGGAGGNEDGGSDGSGD